MVCWHSESFPLILLIMLTNHKSVSQLSKCDYSSSQDNIININIALTKGLKSLTPFHTETMEECLNKCCNGLFIKEGYPCNFMTFAHNKMSSSPNCYLFYCPNEDACPMIPSVGNINYIIKNDQPHEKMLDLSVGKSHSQNREVSSANGILKDFQNVVTDLPPHQRSPILSRTTTLLPVTTLQSRGMQSRVVTTLQKSTFSTQTTSSTPPVATTQLRATATTPVTTKKSTAIIALLNNFSLTSVKTVPTIIFPIKRSTPTRTTALPSTLPVTSKKLTRTSLQTTVLTIMDQAMTTINTKPLTTHTLQTTLQTTTTQPATTTNLLTTLQTTTQSTMATILLTTQQTTTTQPTTSTLQTMTTTQPTTTSTLPTTLQTMTTTQPTTTSTLPTTLQTMTITQPTTTSTLPTTLQTMTTTQPTTTSTLPTTLQTMTTTQPTTTSTLPTTLQTMTTTQPTTTSTLPTTSQSTTTSTLPTTLWTSTTQPIMTTTFPNSQQNTTQPAIITTVVTNPQANNHLSATITLPITSLQKTTIQKTPLRKTQSMTTILPTADLTTTTVSTRKLLPEVTRQSTVSSIPIAKTSLFSIITVVSNNGNTNKKDGEQNQRQNLGGLNESVGKMGSSQMEVKGGLIAALLFGLLFLTIVVIILVKQMIDTFKRRHYTKMDFLMNGIYVDV